ncbi:MAG: CBS domain-containing protein [Candidatus Binataceae bacterium]
MYPIGADADRNERPQRFRQIAHGLSHLLVTVAEDLLMQIANWMTRDPVCITRQDTLARAKELMDAGQFRRLPVIDNDKLVGIVTERDLRQHWDYLDSCT